MYFIYFNTDLHVDAVVVQTGIRNPVSLKMDLTLKAMMMDFWKRDHESVSFCRMSTCL